jgi:hypothetical protein
MYGSPNEVIFPAGTETPAGGPEHAPLIVYTQVFTALSLYMLPSELACAQVGLEAGLRNA